MIIWGSYTPEAVQVEIQTGTLAGFEDMLMDRKLIEQAANVRVSLTDERQQSVAQEVLGVMAVLQGSNGDIYEYMRTLGVMAEVEDEPAEIVGDNVAAYIHRYFCCTTRTPRPRSRRSTRLSKKIPATRSVTRCAAWRCTTRSVTKKPTGRRKPRSVSARMVGWCRWC